MSMSHVKGMTSQTKQDLDIYLGTPLPFDNFFLYTYNQIHEQHNQLQSASQLN